MNYYRRYVGDYLRDTSRLSMLEHGAYNLLLDYYYAEERPIPLDMTEVYRMVRAVMPEERRAVGKVLSTFFTKCEDGWRHKRVDEEISKGTSAIGQMADAGRRGAEKRWGKDRGQDAGVHAGSDGVGHRVEDAGGDTTTNHQPPTTNLQPPTSNLQPEKRSAGAARRLPSSPSSSETWNAYAQAYQRRYGVAPTRNARVNGQLAQFITRVPIAEAPAIAVFYVGHNKAFYVSQRHSVGMLLKDAEGLRTEWLSGRKVTALEARSAEQRDAVREQVTRVAERLEKSA